MAMFNSYVKTSPEGIIINPILNPKAMLVISILTISNPMKQTVTYIVSISHMFHGAGIFTNIGPNHPNVGKYTIHGAYGYDYT